MVRAAIGGAILLAIVAASQGCGRSPDLSQPVFIRSIDWARRGQWLKADTHVHTRFSDGGVPLEDVVRRGEEFGCDVLAITDHADSDRQATSDDYFAALALARNRSPGLVLLAGLEWNVPPWQGREHAVVLVPPELDERRVLRDFQVLFDDWQRDGRDPELARSALHWLAAHADGTARPLVFYNHPGRKRLADEPLAAELADWLDEGAIAVGFEGAPGHQAAKAIGSYRAASPTIDRWDPAAAQIGGDWDQMLQQGRSVWGALATSDFHSANADSPDCYWPGQFSETWLYAPSPRSAHRALSALRSGTFFGVHGHIARKVQLTAAVEGLPRPAMVGEAIRVPAETPITIKLDLEIPPLDWEGKPNRIDEVELIAVLEEGAKVVASRRPAVEGGPIAGGTLIEFVLPMPPGDVAVRARGRRIVQDGPDLMFYTNPIQIFAAAARRQLLATATGGQPQASAPRYSARESRTIPGWMILIFVVGTSLFCSLADRWRVESIRRFSSRAAALAPRSYTTPLGIRRHLLAGLLVFVLLAVYGSWVPFQFATLPWATATEQFRAVLRQPLSFESRTDWATNVLLFVPIGFFATGLFVGRRPSDLRRAAALPLVAIAAAALSLAIEFGQLWMGGRTSSQNDIVAESLGGLGGGCAWFLVGPFVAAWLDRWRAAQRPRERLEHFLEAYLFLVFAYMLMPLDLTVRPAEIWHKLRDGRINLVPLADVAKSLPSALALLGDTLLLMPIGVLAAVWRWPDRDGIRPFGRSLLLAAGVVAAVEGSQLLVLSRFSSTTDLLTGLVGAAFGWYLARHYLVRPRVIVLPARRQRPAGLFWLLGAVLYAALLVGIFCLPFDHLSTPSEAAARWQGLMARPLLAAFYSGTELNAVSEILRKTLLFALLGGLMALAITAAGYANAKRRASIAAAGIAGLMLALGIEALQIYLPPHIADATDAVLGGAGVLLGIASVLWIDREA
jgi:glycopeptide antibiotics resistance protein